ncbi:hypothetical protein K440DRAFT_641857 [Wilcoxina mikolae CBS 423.85]|nr:hypothetical protein K440DRAFT_641857 [Wilcoxina mikolae CBS 423.85]
MMFTSYSTATAIRKTALRSTITVEKAGNRNTLVDQALATTSRYRKVSSPTMVTPDITDSAESPPDKLSSAKSPCARLSSAESPPTKLSSAESSLTKPFPTMDLIPVTSKTKMDHTPVTLPLQLSKFEEVNAGWGELGYKRYYDYLRTIDSSGWVREMVKQHNTTQKNKDCVTKKLKDYWQQSPKLLELLNKDNGMIPVAYYSFKENQSRPYSLSPSAPPPNCQIPAASPVLISSTSPVLISSTPPTEEEKLSDFEVSTSSESLSSEDLSSEIPDIPDTTYDDIIEVVDDVTEVIDEDVKATSSDNESSKTAMTATPIILTPVTPTPVIPTPVTPIPVTLTPIRTKVRRNE